ncbi:MAG: sugar phosphate isomerase/epimerase family protein [Geminicoccaceae bacterium]
MPELERLSINLATVRQRWNLAQALDGCAARSIPAVAPWRDQIAEMGLASARRHVRELGLKVSGVCRGGMFPYADEAGRRRADEDNRRALEEAVELEADCLVLVVGGLAEGSRDLSGARQMVEDGIARLLEQARPAGMRLAIEPLHPMYCADRSCVNTVAQALDLCDRLGEGTGVALDVYHIWWDPDLPAQIRRAGRERIHAFHVCDWLNPTTDLLLDRGMMGDGVIDIPSIRRMVEAEGYEGFHEVEIFSQANWWKRDPGEVLDICIRRHQEAC